MINLKPLQIKQIRNLRSFQLNFGLNKKWNNSIIFYKFYAKYIGCFYVLWTKLSKILSQYYSRLIKFHQFGVLQINLITIKCWSNDPKINSKAIRIKRITQQRLTSTKNLGFPIKFCQQDSCHLFFIFLFQILLFCIACSQSSENNKIGDKKFLRESFNYINLNKGLSNINKPPILVEENFANKTTEIFFSENIGCQDKVTFKTLSSQFYNKTKLININIWNKNFIKLDTQVLLHKEHMADIEEIIYPLPIFQKNFNFSNSLISNLNDLPDYAIQKQIGFLCKSLFEEKKIKTDLFFSYVPFQQNEESILIHYTYYIEMKKNCRYDELKLLLTQFAIPAIFTSHGANICGVSTITQTNSLALDLTSVCGAVCFGRSTVSWMKFIVLNAVNRLKLLKKIYLWGVK